MSLTVHESHVTRLSDSSLYDERCLVCGATDASRNLERPCPGAPKQVLTLRSIAERLREREGTISNVLLMGIKDWLDDAWELLDHDRDATDIIKALVEECLRRGQ